MGESSTVAEGKQLHPQSEGSAASFRESHLGRDRDLGDELPRRGERSGQGLPAGGKPRNRGRGGRKPLQIGPVEPLLLSRKRSHESPHEVTYSEARELAGATRQIHLAMPVHDSKCYPISAADASGLTSRPVF